MAAILQQQQPSTGMTAAQFAYLLWQQQQAKAESGDASAAARDFSQNYTDRANAQIKTSDAYYNMLMALKDQVISTPEQDAGSLENRTNQIVSGLNGTVDRAAAIAGSQAGAQLHKRGMGDSTQASASVNGLTRQYGDVYQKLQEMARQRAFDELKAKQGQGVQALQAVSMPLAQLSNSSLNTAKDMATTSSSAAGIARQNAGSKTQNVLESKLMEALLGSKAVKGGIDDGLDYLGGKVKDLFSSVSAPAPASVFNAEAFYNAPKDVVNYDNWKATEQAANGEVQAKALPISEMLDPTILGPQEPEWFNQYTYDAKAQPAPSFDQEAVVSAQPPAEQQWYTMPEYSDNSFAALSPDWKTDQNYSDPTSTWVPPQEEQTWASDWWSSGDNIWA